MRGRLPGIFAAAVLATLACSSSNPVSTDVSSADIPANEILVGDIVFLDTGSPKPDVVDLQVTPDLLDIADTQQLQCDPGEGCFLDKCTDNKVCQSGWCVQHMGESVCSKTCQEECPAGWSCQQVAGTGPDVVYICVSSYANLCRPCSTNDNCKSVGGAEDACIDYGPDGNFCGGPCGDDGECPWGFSCKEVTTVEGSNLQQCVNDTGECPCTNSSVALGLTTPCQVTNELGICTGKRTCTEDSLTACDAATPAEETCNGQDDDCDGEVDEPALVEGDYVNLCDDGNDCTDDKCMGDEGCVNEVLDTGPCEDGDPCTVADHCIEGTCIGTPVECKDDNPCTDDGCDETGGCIFEPNDNACDDEDPCTVGDQCKDADCIGTELACDCQIDDDCEALEDGDQCNGTLVCDTGALPYKCVVDPGTVVTCPEPEGEDAFCLQASCDPGTGECSFAPNHEGFLCDNANACTVNDKCVGGECAGGTEVNCNDGNPCTDDSCDAGVGCVHMNNEAPCSDGDVCTDEDQCVEGACVGGPAPACDDGNVCTTDTCAPEIGCVHEAMAGDCDDGNACTVGDHCEAGKCVHAGLTNCDDDEVCTTESCDPATGCVYVTNENLCIDDNVCTVGDQCQAGVCISGGLIECDDGNVCTDDQCNALLGCEFTLNQAECDDGDQCTEEDFCNLGACQGTPCWELGKSCSEDGCIDKVCGSMSFDGDGDFVAVPHAEVLNLDDTSYTIEGWLWFEEYSPAWVSTVMAKFTGGGIFREGWAFMVGGEPSGIGPGAVAGGHYYGEGVTPVATAIASPEGSATTKQWMHAAITYDKDTQTGKVWLDGKLAGEASAEPPVATESDLHIGSLRAAPCPDCYYWKGLIDELRISSTVRYTEEFIPTAQLFPDAETLALWDFNEGQGVTAHDASGNGHDGVVKGATWSNNGPAEGCCITNCEDMECGADGCGGSCGECGEETVCVAGLCEWGVLGCGDVACPPLAGYTVSCNPQAHCEYANEDAAGWKAWDTWIWIPPGTFPLGGPDDEPGHPPAEGPMHDVTFAKGYFISKYEIVVEQYEACIAANPGKCTPASTVDWDGNGWGTNSSANNRSHHPQNGLTWQQARDFCGWVAPGGRLPSEAQWEYAAKGPVHRKYPWGDSPLPSCTNNTAMFNEAGEGAGYGCGLGGTSEAGSKTAGPSWSGAMDMAGNLWEWCEDWWHPTYEGAPWDGSAWVDDGTWRVVRGGSFDVSAFHLRTSWRPYHTPTHRFANDGARCVMPLPEVCAPDCEGKECGEDGCGGSCGECGAGMLCVNALCTSGCDDGNEILWDGCCDGEICEFQVNTYTDSEQSYPAVATSADGGFFASWTSANQEGDGWADTWGQYGQGFDNAGDFAGEEQHINEINGGWEMHGVIGALPSGSYVMVWEVGGLFSPLKARYFGANGLPKSSEFTISSCLAQRPDVAVWGNGRYVVAYESGVSWNSCSGSPDTSGASVRFAIIDEKMGPISTEHTANVWLSYNQGWPSVAVWDGGGFVVAWSSCTWDEPEKGQDGSGCGVFARVFNETGEPTTQEIWLADNKSGDQDLPRVATLPGGEFVVAWRTEIYGDDGGGCVLRVFEQDGTPQSDEVLLSTAGGCAHFTRPLVRSDGGFDIFWPGDGIMAKSFDSGGELSLPFLNEPGVVLVGPNQGPSAGDPEAARFKSNGGFVLVWSSAKDGSGTGIFAQRFDKDGNKIYH